MVQLGRSLDWEGSEPNAGSRILARSRPANGESVRGPQPPMMKHAAVQPFRFGMPSALLQRFALSLDIFRREPGCVTRWQSSCRSC